MFAKKTFIMLLILLAVAACATSLRRSYTAEQMSALLSGQPKSLHNELRAIYEAPKKNEPLGMMGLGVKALAAGEIKFSQNMFEKTAEAVETIYGDSEQAKNARSAFRQEANKLFIGETHERAMVFHYLGLIDLTKGDYQNARASFRASLLQDSLAGSDEFRQDFASSSWLRGWASHCVGGARANNDFAKAKKTISYLAPPARGDNLVVVAEIGQAPMKITQGEYDEKLAYQESRPTPAERSWDGARFGLARANDLLFQAATRGDRNFDEYLKAQRENKDMAKKIGNTALLSGLILLDAAGDMQDGTAQAVTAIVGLAALAAGGVAYAIGAAINPTADTRRWENLPRTIYIGSFQIATNTNNVGALKQGNQQLSRLVRWAEDNQKSISTLFTGKGRCRLLWLRDQSADFSKERF